MHATLELESTRCDLCDSDDAELLFVASDQRYGVPGEFPLVRCRHCTLVYVNPRPTPASLGRYYPTRYSPHQATNEQHRGRAGALLRAAAFQRFDGPLGTLGAWLYNSLAYRAFLRNSAGGRMLDVGCGTGEYLAVCRDLGWKVEGIEPSIDAAAVARTRLGAPVHAGFVEDIPLAEGAFDAVAMSHSFEHVRSPRRVLSIVHRALARRGRLLLMVPNFGSWDRRLFGSRWHGLEVPRHLYHFEPRTITALLTDAGFDVEQIGGSSHGESIVRSAGAALGRDTERAPAAVSRLLGLAMLPLAAARRSTNLWVVARRR